jgi:hypothetical protein
MFCLGVLEGDIQIWSQSIIQGLRLYLLVLTHLLHSPDMQKGRRDTVLYALLSRRKVAMIV